MFPYKPVQFLLGISFFFCTSCGQATGPSREIDEDVSNRGVSKSTKDSNTFHSYSGWQEAISFFVEASAPDQVVEAAYMASSVWNDAVGRQVLVASGVISSERGNSLYSSLEDEKTVIYFVQNWHASTGKSSTTLATTVWQNANDSDRIVKGDILLNAEEYSFLDAMTVSSSSWDGKVVVDTETVLLHEFGHLMGLEHSNADLDANSIMHPKTFIGAKVTARTPSALDVGHVKSLYE